MSKATEKVQGPACVRLWTIQEVGEFLGVPVPTLYYWRHRGEGPPAARLGRLLRYDPAQVRAWVAERSEAV